MSAGDRIVLRGLRVRGFHGVLPAERRDGQEFVVDAVLFMDTRASASSDDLADTVDYGELAKALRDVIAGDPVDLLETLAARLADSCMTDHRVVAAEITVHKPQAQIGLDFQDIAVTVRRERP